MPSFGPESFGPVSSLWNTGASLIGNLCVADLYFSATGTLFDLTKSANRALFHTATGGAMALGPNAQWPTGAGAPIFLSSQTGSPADLATNYGTGGPFGTTGALTLCGGNPPIGYSAQTIQNRLVMWDGQHWFTGSQQSSLVYIGSQQLNGTFTIYGTDGARVFPICQNRSAMLPKTVVSKLWAQPHGIETEKNATRIWTVTQSNSITPPTIAVTVDNEATSVAVTEANITGANIGYWQYIYDVNQSGFMTGLTIKTSAADIVLVEAGLGVQLYSVRV